MTKLTTQFKAVWMCALLFLGLPVMSFAGGSTCAAATGLIADGRVLSLDYIQPGAAGQPSAVWYSFPASSGHSYSVEVRDDLDGNPNGDLAFTFYSASCATQMSGTSGPSYSANQYRDTSAIDPAVTSNTGMRVSIPNPNTDTIAVKVVNSSTTIGHYVSVSVSETTLFGPAWLDTGTFNTFYAFVNATSATINGSFTFWDTVAGQVVAPSPIAFSIPPRGKSTNTSAMNVTRGLAGSVTFTHDGPPGSLAADGALADFGATPPYVQSITLVPLRQAAH